MLVAINAFCNQFAVVYLFVQRFVCFFAVLFLVRSPVLVHVSNSLVGLITIRASQNTEIIQREFQKLLNYNNQAFYAYICVQRWFQLRLDLIGAVYGTITVLTSVLAKGIF